MRILSIIHHTDFSGPTNRNMRIAPFLAAKEIDFWVLVPDTPLGSAYQRLKEAGVNVAVTRFHRLRTSRNLVEQVRIFFNFFFDIQRIRKIIRKKKIDVVQLNGLMNPHGAIAAKLEGKKVVWQLIDTRSPFLLMLLLMPLVALLSDAVMATGAKTVAAHPMNRLIRNRLQFFYPPVDIKRFSSDLDVKKEARKTIGLTPEDTVVGTVGTINPQKGHRCFIDAAKVLLVQHPNVKFVIIGSELDTQKKYAIAIRKYAGEQGLALERNLFFIDPKDRVHFFEQALDLFWMTSVPRSEGIPTAIEEAMALGLPVVGTDLGSVSEIVKNGKTGFVVAPHDARAIAKHTGYLISHPEVMEVFGQKAKKTAPVFSSQNCADSHYACYRFC